MISPGLAIGPALRIRTAWMGLGEYTYIYAMAYHEQLLDAASEGLFIEQGPVPDDVLAALRAMLSRQRDALIPQGDTQINAQGDAQGDARFAIQQIEAEIAALERDSRRLPWRDGLPSTIEDSLVAFRDRLGQVHCGPTTGIEMDVTAGRAIRLALY